MLLEAITDIPGTIQIVPGQQFHELDAERAAYWLRTGMARLPAGKVGDDTGPLNWPGATVVVIASGPSLTEEQCATVERWHATPSPPPLRKVIAINTSFRRAPFADLLYACDGTWWDEYAEEAKAVYRSQQLWTQDEPAAKRHGLRHIKSAATRGLSRTKGLIHQGMNSTYQAINLAYLAGARRFVLLGLDCHGGHWHGDHPAALNKKLPHKQWLERFAVLAADLRQEGIEVVNCSPGTALRAFPTGLIDAELAK